MHDLAQRITDLFPNMDMSEASLESHSIPIPTRPQRPLLPGPLEEEDMMEGQTLPSFSATAHRPDPRLNGAPLRNGLETARTLLQQSRPPSLVNLFYNTDAFRTLPPASSVMRTPHSIQEQIRLMEAQEMLERTYPESARFSCPRR